MGNLHYANHGFAKCEHTCFAHLRSKHHFPQAVRLVWTSSSGPSFLPHNSFQKNALHSAKQLIAFIVKYFRHF